MVMRSEADAGKTLYQVTARAERADGLWQDDTDRQLLLSMLGEVCDRFEWRIHGYALLSHHYHLLVEPLYPNLAQGVRQLHSLYTRAANQRHRRLGQLFHGRFGSMRVARERLLELNRYVVLSPVRAGLVSRVKDWPWSSYRATAGLALSPHWLATQALLAELGEQRTQAVVAYVGFVAAGLAGQRPKLELPPVLVGSAPPVTLAAHLRGELVRRRG